MKLVLPLSVGDERFIEFLIKRLFAIIISSASHDKLRVIDIYNDMLSEDNKLFPDSMTASEVLLRGAMSIWYSKDDVNYTIEIPTDSRVGKHNVELSTLCRVIDNGNMDIPGYPIFTESFKFIKNNLSTYKKLYNNTTLGGML